MKKAFYPPLIAMFLVLVLFDANTNQLLSSSDIITPLLISLGGALALWGVLRLVLKSWSRAALPACLLVVMCLEYGHFRGAFGLNESVTLGIWIAVFAVSALMTARIKKLPTFAFNVVACTLMLVALTPFSVFVLTTPTTEGKAVTLAPSDTNTPDIYYIITDEYSRDDALLDVCDFDNSEFINYLRSKDFYVSGSYANYPVSGLSLVSALNMNYISEDIDDSDVYTYIRDLRQQFLDNEVCRQLKQRGYTIINIGSLYAFSRSFSAHFGLGDISYDHSSPDEFYRLWYEMTIAYIECTTEREFYNTTLYQFRVLREIPKMPEPTFTFVHIFAAHTPFVFNADGSFRGKYEAHECTPELYVEQIKAINSMLYEAVDEILSRNDDAIIIIQGDTGFSPKYTTPDLREKPRTAWARLANLNVVRAPECNDVFTSPVNTFRHIFNQYFNTDYEVLPDKYFWVVGEFREPHELCEVTDILRKYEKEANK